MFNLVLSAFVVSMLAAQAASTPVAPATPAPVAPKTTPAAMRLNGRVSRENETSGIFTLAQTGTDTKYRLSGVALQKYMGQRVEIVGAPVKRGLVIRGGLVPSPNVAAQAGDMDPAKAAVASQPGGPSTGVGTVDLPEFRVTSVHTLGGCVTQR